MDIGFLEEYEIQEKERISKSNSILERCDPLQKPISYVQAFPNHSIWGQIPFAGTSIFIIKPMSETMFLDVYDLKRQDIPELIKFAQETKKIQFVLEAMPTKYQSFDYLQPILEEFHPPVRGIKSEFNGPAEEMYKQIEKEIKPLLRFSPEWNTLKFVQGGEFLIHTFISEFALMRYFGFDEIADIVLENILIKPYFALDYLGVASTIFLEPLTEPFNAVCPLDMEMLRKAINYGFLNSRSISEIQHQEIGSFLLRSSQNYYLQLSPRVSVWPSSKLMMISGILFALYSPHKSLQRVVHVLMSVD
ncbi:hypothetical protein [Methanosphaerula subterraneus]|uniref:hypothetical protein n=1 Tax=Methanosphaerula subterraneus TaxID=3350244 RepID=UPI003F833096